MEFFTVQDPGPLKQWIVSLLLGMLVGLQRQWAGEPLAGIRTFALVAFLGTLCAYLAERFGLSMIYLGFGAATALMLAGHFSAKKQANQDHSGLGTEIALILMYLNGVLVHIGPLWLSMACAGTIAALLQFKIELHGLASRFTSKEIKAIMQFVLISLVILPIVPNDTIGPLKVLNPHEIWLMVVFIVGLSLTGYIAYKFFGDRAGIFLSGILGGIIASTASTITNARRTASDAASAGATAFIIYLSWAVVYIRLLVEVFAVANNFGSIFYPLIIMFVSSLVIMIWMWKSSIKTYQGMPIHANPSELRTALGFAIIYGVVIFAVAFAKEYFGGRGLAVVAVLSGITDMDAITLSTSRLVATGKMLDADAWPIIILALISNLVFKGVMAFVIGGRELRRFLLIPWLTSLAVGFLILSRVFF